MTPKAILSSPLIDPPASDRPNDHDNCGANNNGEDKILRDLVSHLPDAGIPTCILSRATEKSSSITKAYIVAQATKHRKLRKYEWLLGYNAGKFNFDSHFNITYMELGWHALFDRGRWFMVPEKSARTSILEKLKDIKKQRGSTKAVDAPESTSYWPLFETVITEPDKVYSYRFVNVDIVNNAFTVMDNDSWTLVNVRNIDHPLLTLQSHIHPLHVILNAYPKIQAWTPRPTDAPTLEIIGDIAAIWEVWNSVPPTSEYLRYSETDSADNSSLGTLSTTISRNHLSGYHGPRKRGKSDDEGDEQQGPTTRARRFYGQRRRIDDIFYELSSTSQEASVDSLDSEYMINIQGWQDRLHTARLSSARDPGLDEDEEVRDSVNGSPKVTGYTRWEPLWDRRHPDTTQFSSNDWALLRNGCDLSGEYRPVALKDL